MNITKKGGRSGRLAMRSVRLVTVCGAFELSPIADRPSSDNSYRTGE